MSKIKSLIESIQNNLNESIENKIVKDFINLPYEDFKMENTIGNLNNGKCFIVFDDNTVYVVNSNLSELKKAAYNNEDFNDFMEQYAEPASDEDTNKILLEINRIKEEN